MEKLFTLLVIMAISLCAFAQSPQKMSYQCVIRNASGVLVTSQSIRIRISILQGTSSGAVVYTETQTPTTNANGLVSIEIGGGAGFDAISWAAGTYFIKTETDPPGGTNYTIVGPSQLLSVPYAIFAKTAETSIDANNLRQQIKILENNLIAAGIYKVVDIEGNQYSTIKIGEQIWMAENLKTTKYRNGDLIGTTTPATLDITSETTPKYQWAYGGNESYVATYGRLYTWFAVTDNHNLCPTGWHVPNDAEWTTLSTFLGDETVAGGKLKEAGTAHWISPNTGASNVTGFTALPSGYRYNDGNFYVIGFNIFLWSSTEYSSTNAFSRSMFYIDSELLRNSPGNFKHYGYSVRCLQDF